MHSEILYFVAQRGLGGDTPIPKFFEENRDIKKEDKLYIFRDEIGEFFPINGKKIVIDLISIPCQWRIKDESIFFEDFAVKCKSSKSKYYLRSIQSARDIWESIYLTRSGYYHGYSIIAAKPTDKTIDEDEDIFEYEKKFYKETYVGGEHRSGYAFEIFSLDREKFKKLFLYLIKEQKIPDKFKRREIFSHIIQFL